MPGSILEGPQRLSHSILWKLQRRFFETQGIDAWRKSIVPHYITSNPFIARSYSRIVSGFFRDCLASNLISDPDQPVYIIELGAGSGRFSYHFLKSFLAHAEFLRQKEGIRFRYIMSDFAPQTIAYWQSHPSLLPFVKESHLAFARYDVGGDALMELSGSQQPLLTGTVRNPLVVIANYFFDGIPQDYFSIRGGELYEQLAGVRIAAGDADQDAPDLLDRIQVDFESRPASADYYGDPDLDRLLDGYQHRLIDADFLFPCSALRCVRDLSRLSGGRMLLVSADQGYSSEEELLRQGTPEIRHHGSFSMLVNYHALGEYVQKCGGQVLHPASSPSSLNVSCFVLGIPDAGTPETRRIFDETVVQFGPDDFFSVKMGIAKAHEHMTLSQLLAYLRLGGGDGNMLLGVLPALTELAQTCTDVERVELKRALQQVWENYYPIGEEQDLPFEIGVLLYRAAWYKDALEMFAHSLRLQGPCSWTLYNMGLCHYMLGEQEAAQACMVEARRLDPGCGEPPWETVAESEPIDNGLSST
jgi:hypothetical protein